VTRQKPPDPVPEEEDPTEDDDRRGGRDWRASSA